MCKGDLNRDGECRSEPVGGDVARPPATAQTCKDASHIGPSCSRGTSARLVESPWLWACVFLSGALVALQLTGPKFSWRQPQIERQFQARQRSGLSVSHGQAAEYSRTGEPMLTLRPLFLLTGVGLIVAWGLFLWHHVRRRVP